MGRLNVSSVKAPSEMTASPEQNTRKDLDAMVFGTAGNSKNVQNKPKKNSRLDLFMSEAEQTEEVNDMLIDAIKAKLAILDQMDD